MTVVRASTPNANGPIKAGEWVQLDRGKVAHQVKEPPNTHIAVMMCGATFGAGRLRTLTDDEIFDYERIRSCATCLATFRGRKR